MTWPLDLIAGDPEVWLKIFALRRDDYAIQQANGIYFPAREPLTTEVVLADLEGAISIGPYVHRGSECRFGVVDADYQGGLLDIQRLGFWLQGLGLPPQLNYLDLHVVTFG